MQNRLGKLGKSSQQENFHRVPANLNFGVPRSEGLRGIHEYEYDQFLADRFSSWRL